MTVRRPGHGARAALAASVLALSVLGSWSCSSKSSGGFGGGDDGSTATGDDAAAGGSGSGSSSGGSGSGASSGFQLPDANGGGGPGCSTGSGTCKDGMYSGMFECSFMFGDGGATSDAGFDGGGFVITGTISFTVSQNTASAESFIDTASGVLGGNCCLDLFSINATVGGMLNCNSGDFAGSLTKGTYTGFGMTGDFSGPLSACYDGATSSFNNGTWNLAVPGYGNCVGIWSASYTDQ